MMHSMVEQSNAAVVLIHIPLVVQLQRHDCDLTFEFLVFVFAVFNNSSIVFFVVMNASVNLLGMNFSYVLRSYKHTTMVPTLQPLFIMLWGFCYCSYSFV